MNLEDFNLIGRLRNVVAGDDYLDGELDDLIYDDESDDLDTRKKNNKGPRSVRKAKVAGRQAQRKVQNFTQAKINQLQDAIKSKSGKIPFGPETPGVRGFKNSAGYAANPLVQSTIYAPFILGGMETARDALHSDRGRAFTQSVTSGNYGEALRHLTGGYQYNVPRIPVDLSGNVYGVKPNLEELNAQIAKLPSILRQDKNDGDKPINKTEVESLKNRNGEEQLIPESPLRTGPTQAEIEAQKRFMAQREEFRTAPEVDRMRTWMNAGNNMEMAKRVKRGQAGFEEIQAVLAEEEGGPAADKTLEKMYQYGRSAEDAAVLASDKPMSMEWTTDMSVDDQSIVSPLAGRNTAAPTGAFAQYGTQMSGSSNPFASIALPGTTQGLSQLFLTPGQMKMPDSSSYINVDAFDGAGNFGADKLDLDRFLPFLGIDTDQELNRITNIIRRKK